MSGRLLTLTRTTSTRRTTAAQYDNEQPRSFREFILGLSDLTDADPGIANGNDAVAASDPGKRRAAAGASAESDERAL